MNDINFWYIMIQLNRDMKALLIMIGFQLAIIIILFVWLLAFGLRVVL